jgi:hypothetical protein
MILVAWNTSSVFRHLFGSDIRANTVVTEAFVYALLNEGLGLMLDRTDADQEMEAFNVLKHNDIYMHHLL